MSIRDRVHARRDLDGLRAARDLTGLADALNAEGLMAPQQRFITGRVIATLHPTEGREILRRLEAMATQDIGLRFNLPFLQQGEGLDIGDPDMWKELDRMVLAYHASEGALGLSDLQASLLKSLSLKPVIVDRLEVEAALYNRDTTEK